MQLVATPDTDCYFWFWPPLCSGTHFSISVSHMSVELVQFMFQLLNLVMFIQIFTHVKFAENIRSWQWEEVYFFAEFVLFNSLFSNYEIQWLAVNNNLYILFIVWYGCKSLLSQWMRPLTDYYNAFSRTFKYFPGDRESLFQLHTSYGQLEGRLVRVRESQRKVAAYLGIPWAPLSGRWSSRPPSLPGCGRDWETPRLTPPLYEPKQ